MSNVRWVNVVSLSSSLSCAVLSCPPQAHPLRCDAALRASVAVPKGDDEGWDGMGRAMAMEDNSDSDSDDNNNGDGC